MSSSFGIFLAVWCVVPRKIWQPRKGAEIIDTVEEKTQVGEPLNSVKLHDVGSEEGNRQRVGDHHRRHSIYRPHPRSLGCFDIACQISVFFKFYF
jgi:hypothetical protein